MNKIRSLFPILFLLFGMIILWSQVVPDGKTISSISIELEGPDTIGKSFILQNLQIETGIPYKSNAIDKSITNLMATGAIDDVKVFLDPETSTEQEVALVFKVYTKSRIGTIIFEGNDKLSDRKLEKEIEISIGELLDESEIKADQRTLQELYLEKGFWNSQVESQILTKEGGRSVSVIFKIIEKEKRKIGNIIFEGNKNISEKKLLQEMETAPWRFWRFWSKRSRYRPSIFEEDLIKLRTVFRDEGFLDVTIEQSGVKIIPKGSNSLDVIIEVKEGERSFFGEISIVGNSVITTKDLKRLDSRADKELRTGDHYSPTLLSEERNRLRKKYGEKGYLDARVVSIRKPNLQTGQIDLRFEITENNKFTVNTIQVRGNEKTKTTAIVRELALAPGETFDLLRMETSEARLRNTRFFEKVTLDDEPIASQDPELQSSRRNLVVNVEEGRTGHVSFGVGFSTLEKAMMFAEFRQGNFDIMRWRSPHRLQGDGQKFRLRLKLGARSNEVRLALEEPWFMNRRVAAGFELFREKSDYYSSYYDEMRAGFEVYFRKRLFELVEGRLFYRLEDVIISDIGIGVPPFITNDPKYDPTKKEIDRTISKVGLSLTRDTRNSILFPSEGSIVTLRKEFAGGPFGGDADYGRFELQGAKFFETFTPMEQVLSIVGRTGTLGRFDGKDADVPFFEKFFLGGPYNLRGWDYREAGPQVLEEPNGGNSYSYLSAEYTFKIADPLRFAVFYDGGFLRSNDFKFMPGDDMEGWHDNWGLGARIMVMGMPLRLDLGFPITDPTKTGGSPQFHFSGGTRF
ncbi:MAG: outer membrane protein assembly factor BamA [Opitutales bacterium]|nr:outer membrane protein assembly factor BamA [Opitutales bacterium]MDG1324792.1 outer membrane protein assembly factor BamA [Opitutales bacterium]